MASAGSPISVSSTVTVFVNSSLGTNLALSVSLYNTIASLKRSIEVNHVVTFPDIGCISVKAIKMKKKGSLYHICDKSVVETLFHGLKGECFLQVDAVPIERNNLENIDIATNNNAIIPLEKKCKPKDSYEDNSVHDKQLFSVNPGDKGKQANTGSVINHADQDVGKSIFAEEKNLMDGNLGEKERHKEIAPTDEPNCSRRANETKKVKSRKKLQISQEATEAITEGEKRKSKKAKISSSEILSDSVMSKNPGDSAPKEVEMNFDKLDDVSAKKLQIDKTVSPKEGHISPYNRRSKEHLGSNACLEKETCLTEAGQIISSVLIDLKEQCPLAPEREDDEDTGSKFDTGKINFIDYFSSPKSTNQPSSCKPQRAGSRIGEKMVASTKRLLFAAYSDMIPHDQNASGNTRDGESPFAFMSDGSEKMNKGLTSSPGSCGKEKKRDCADGVVLFQTIKSGLKKLSFDGLKMLSPSQA